MFGFGKKKIDPNCAEEILRRRKLALEAIEKGFKLSSIEKEFCDNDRVEKLINYFRSHVDTELYTALGMLGLPKSESNVKLAIDIRDGEENKQLFPVKEKK